MFPQRVGAKSFISPFFCSNRMYCWGGLGKKGARTFFRTLHLETEEAKERRTTRLFVRQRVADAIALAFRSLLVHSIQRSHYVHGN